MCWLRTTRWARGGGEAECYQATWNTPGCARVLCRKALGVQAEASLEGHEASWKANAYDGWEAPGCVPAVYLMVVRVPYAAFIV